MTEITNDLIDTMNDIASEVMDERIAQLEKWGHQDRDSIYSANQLVEFARTADRWKSINDARDDRGRCTWDGILLEEVFEALCETDPQKRRAELVQVAAVACAEIQNIDERAAAEPVEEEGESNFDPEAFGDGTETAEDAA